ncbi:MAG: dihydrolipoamide dehydrogenase [bacterium P3]|nr:MAG: dihydrolipoamide dehydrogenase [bacterium P3]KWW41829.1 MAG: dihydrolipoamide dehydrogenase [bacterium F083]
MKYDLIVIGSGPGGYVAAVRGAQCGLKTAVVERENLGGVCLNWGCIPTKALLKSAQVYTYLRHAADYGVGADGVAADLDAMVRRSRGVAETMSKGVAFLMQKHNVEVLKGTGKVLPGHRVEVSGPEGVVCHEADHIIIATGARSKVMPSMPQDGRHIIGYREAMTLPFLPKSMLVCGSGAIGSEFAFFYQSIGVQVTLVEFMPQILPNEDEETAATVSRSFRKIGMKVMTSSSVEKVDIDGDICHVTVKDTKKNTEVVVDCDVVLSAVGVVTNLEGIGLEETGIATERGKIVVDDFYQTSVPGYYAIGDVVHGPALAHVAEVEAVCCVEHLAGGDAEKINYDNVPGCTYISPEVASVGLTEKKAREAGYDLRVGKTFFRASGRATAAGNTDGFVKVLIDRQTDRIVGCHLCGEGVTEMIAGVVVARQNGLTARQVAGSIHPHPTMSESIREAIDAAYEN